MIHIFKFWAKSLAFESLYLSRFPDDFSYFLHLYFETMTAQHFPFSLNLLYYHCVLYAFTLHGLPFILTFVKFGTVPPSPQTKKTLGQWSHLWNLVFVNLGVPSKTFGIRNSGVLELTSESLGDTYFKGWVRINFLIIIYRNGKLLLSQLFEHWRFCSLKSYYAI